MLYYTKSYTTQIRSVTPSASEMDIINQLSLERLEPEQVFIGRMALCNDQYDRRDERIPETYLKRFVDTVYGKSVLTGHNYGTDPVGRFFDAEVRKTSAGLEFVPTYYMLSDDALLPKIKSGVIKHVSVGFYPDIRVCDICNLDYDGWWTAEEDDPFCKHIKGREYEVDGQKVKCRVTYGGDVQKAEMVEGSFVWLGCQYGAETIAKGLDGREVDLSPEAKAAFLRGKGGSKIHAVGLALPAGVKREAPSDKEKAMEDTEKKAGGSADPKQEALAKSGQKYRERIFANIKRCYAACDMEATGLAIVKALDRVDEIEELEGAETDAQKLFDEHVQPKSSAAPKEGEEKAPAGSESKALTLAASPMGGWPEGDYL